MDGDCRGELPRSGGNLTITKDVKQAVIEADFIYTDLWWWVGQEAEIPKRRKAFMPKYQVNMETVSGRHLRIASLCIAYQRPGCRSNR